MKHQWIAKAIALVILGLAACQPVQAMSAAQSADAQTCSLATLKGRYIGASSGTIVPPAFGVTEPTPGQTAGFHIFNGDGTGKDIVTVRVNGQIFVDKFEVPISYKVNADCTGSYTADVKDGPTFELFIAPKGDSYAIIATNPGNYLSEIDSMVAPK